MLSRPEAGDTAWLLDTSLATEAWIPHPITGVVDVAAVCAIGSGQPVSTPRPLLGLRLSGPVVNARVVRVTRPWRYSLYRASDGRWYVGAREWSPALLRFNTIQPVAGPLMSAAAGGLRFHYRDSVGAEIAPAPADSRGIAAIEVAFRIDSTIPGRYAHSTSIRPRSSVVVALRNRVR
jgi:hypothetical protein